MKKIVCYKAQRCLPKALILATVFFVLGSFISSSLIYFDGTDAKLKKTDPAICGAIYRTLEVMDQVFEENDLEYWIEAGTLLGAVRHKGIIPWNDDADVYFSEKDLKKLVSLKKTFAKKGYQLVETFGGYKLMPASRPNRRQHPSIDIAPTRHEDGIVYPSWEGSPYRARNEGSYFTEKELYPLQRMTFGPLKLKAPNNPIGFLNRYYGHDWNEVAYRTFDHQTWKKVAEIKTKLVNRKPAEYDREVYHGHWPSSWQVQKPHI
ncbi:MAG: LicD family protein [Chlamydiota bacterium]